MMKLNKEWHLSHRMPKNATLEQRIAWHLEHVKNYGCRGVPEKLKKDVESKKKTKRILTNAPLRKDLVELKS